MKNASMVIIAVICLAATADGGEKATFVDLEKAQHIFGPEITAADLKGKVVLLEYWGINCPPCRESIPHLVMEQKRHAATGKFTVLASHVQEYSDKVVEFLKEKRVNFPVFQQFRESAAPCGRGIPSAALIDHTGEVVAQGHPMELLPKVAALVKAAPNPAAAILGDVVVKHCKTEAKALASGNPVDATLKALDEAAEKEGPKAEEAKALAAAARAYLEARQKEIENLAEQKPAKAYLALTDFIKQITGLPGEEPMKALAAKLGADKNVKALSDILERIAKARAAETEKSAAEKTAKALAKAKADLQKLLKDETLSDALRKEAEAAMGALP